jgi:hypothetical protein
LILAPEVSGQLHTPVALSPGHENNVLVAIEIRETKSLYPDYLYKNWKVNKLKIHNIIWKSASMDLALERRCREIRMREI